VCGWWEFDRGFVGLVYGSGRAQPAGDGLGPAGMRSYSQTFRVTFKTEEAARLAELRIVPLITISAQGSLRAGRQHGERCARRRGDGEVRTVWDVY